MIIGMARRVWQGPFLLREFLSFLVIFKEGKLWKLLKNFRKIWEVLLGIGRAGSQKGSAPLPPSELCYNITGKEAQVRRRDGSWCGSELWTLVVRGVDFGRMVWQVTRMARKKGGEKEGRREKEEEKRITTIRREMAGRGQITRKQIGNLGDRNYS